MNRKVKSILIGLLVIFTATGAAFGIAEQNALDYAKAATPDFG